LLLTSSGDGLLAGVLVGLAAAELLPGAVAVLAVLGALSRFGATTLPAIAGAQSVLGPALAVGPFMGALGSVLAAGACLLAVPRRRGWIVPALLGGVAALVSAGPAMSGGVGDSAIRLGALVVWVAGAVGWARWGRGPRRVPATLVALAGLALCVAAPR
jgi:hypothetical protein